ncbi:MAG: hypothetical protein ACLSD2_07100 [Clostridia bacterium]|jgi:hypothetical protein|nr:hypothetical protein [Clostridia bacterium]MED9923713.1 hypothetical protein [Clostridia bacterium]CDC07020.1 unknown [Clostridium sp. CAG:343]HCF34491.1 hypothetical protein [Clostridiales bacterium]
MEENIADALKMAGSVLLFVMGLSIAILAFSQARESMDIVLSYSDRESLSIEGNPRFYYLSKDNDTSRYVGKETIIPAIYRAYKENYKIVFKFPDDYYLFKQEVKNAKGLNKEKKISTLDLANQSLSSDLASRQFLNGIIYGDFEYENEKSKNDYINKFKITPNDISLYQYLTEKESTYKIKEYLGTYYIEDVNGTSEVNAVNKTEKRVITYEFVNR